MVRPLARMGFTLVELLIVISVMAVLIGMLLPAINAVRESARTTKCLNNLRQITLATFAYTNDNDNHLPMAVSGYDAESRGYEGQTLGSKIAPYLDAQDANSGWSVPSSKIFICPDSPIIGIVQTGSGLLYDYGGGNTSPTSSYEGAFYYQYAMNTSAQATAITGLENYREMTKTPWQFCSNRNAPVAGFAGLQGQSWHHNFRRPTAFLDGHARALNTPVYINGGGNAQSAPINNQSLLLGPYSSYELVTGTGSPAHAPGDFAISEY